VPAGAVPDGAADAGFVPVAGTVGPPISP
jgi:hypothetical protein